MRQRIIESSRQKAAKTTGLVRWRINAGPNPYVLVSLLQNSPRRLTNFSTFRTLTFNLERVRGARHRIHSWHRFEQHIGDEISLSYVWFCLTLLTTDGRTAVVVVPFDVIWKRDPRARARVRVTAKTIDATFENRWNPVEMTEKWHGS